MTNVVCPLCNRPFGDHTLRELVEISCGPRHNQTATFIDLNYHEEE